VKKILVLLLSAILVGLLYQTALADSGKGKAAEAAASALPGG